MFAGCTDNFEELFVTGYADSQYPIWYVNFINIHAQSVDSLELDVGGYFERYINDIILTSDSRYVACGDERIIRFDRSGNVYWLLTGQDGWDYYWQCVAEGTDGSYLAAADDSHETDEGIYCCGISSNGTFLWETLLHNTSGDFPRSTEATPDGGYVVGTSDGEIYKLSSDGDSLWRYEYEGAYWIVYTDIVISGDDIVACGCEEGSSQQPDHSILTRLDSDGNLVWEREYENVSLYKLYNALDNGFIMTGVDWLDNSYPYSLGLILKTDSLGYFDETGIEGYELIEDLELLLHPNPAQSSFSAGFSLSESAPVILEIFDLSGRCVYISTGTYFDAGRNEITVDGLTSGIYLVRVTSDQLDGTGKMVIINR
ncbi:hypothetical protein DRQ25_08380 [Candidatus Fermentibacteria bacterium]|nr:MAG: hypothetical protein DRQ25_08380 [Candidatus Fermentibacteria bacterium]